MRFSLAIENFMALKLTLSGKITLTAYEDKIIRYADEALSRVLAKKKLDNPYTYLLSICNAKAYEQKSYVNYEYAYKLLRDNKIDQSSAKYFGDREDYFNIDEYSEAAMLIEFRRIWKS